MGTKVLNIDGIQDVFIAADAATELAGQATAKALEATRLAISAAGKAATTDAVIAHVLAILRAEVGNKTYNPRGAWSAETVYKQNDLVSYIGEGVIGAFVALKDVPQGVLPTDTEFWKGFGKEAAPPRVTLTVAQGDALTLAPGGTVNVPLLLERFNLAADTGFVFGVASDEPGVTGETELVPPTEGEQTQDEGLGEEDLVEGRGQEGVYTLTLAATDTTPEGPLTLRISATVEGWVDDPAHPLYALTDETTLSVVVAAAGTAIAPNATAVYGMAGAASYTAAEFGKDSGAGGLHLIRLGDVRPAVRADAWLSEGTPGSVLHTPPLTGHTMNGAQELGVIVRDPEALPNGSVVAAFASATRKHDYAYIYKTSEGFKVRTAVQNAAGTGAETKDSAAVPLGTRLALVCDPATQTVALHAVREGKSVSTPRPTWTSGGVRASFFGVMQQGDAVLNPSSGEIVAATVHKAVLEPIRRDRNAQRLVDDYATPSTVGRKGEYPSGTRLILEMKPGEVTRDRTFYDASHTLTLLGDAAAGAEGGVVTSGAAGSGAETGFMPDVTWEQDFTIAYVADNFFADPVGQCYLALASQNQAGAFVKFTPRPVGAENPTDDVFFIAVTGGGIPNVRGTLENVGKKPAHLFFMRYTAETRKLAFSELFSGRSLAEPLTLPVQNFSGPIRLTLGFAYKGVATEFSRTRHAGAWIGVRDYNAAEEAAALAALGIAAAELTPTGNTPTAPSPAASSLVAPQVFDASSLGTGELRRVYDELAKPGWLYMANSKRDKKVGDNPRWEDSYASRYETRTHNGERYRFYTGPKCGQYFLGRGTAGMSFAVVSHAFRAAKDLRLLDTACYDVETLMDAARDDSGIESSQPDGFLGFTYGCDPQLRLFFAPDDSRNTATINEGKLQWANNPESGNSGMKQLTGVEKGLEEGLMLAWMVTALGAHANIDKFSPTYEPEGKRPATPEYYRRVRDKAIKVYEDTNKKWDAYWQGRRESELPMHVRRTLIHSALSELAAAIAYAKIKGGANWQNTSLYAECVRAWNLIFGPTEEVGVAKKVHHATWYEARHPRYGKCLISGHQVRRYKPSGTKDATGEYLSSTSENQNPHPNNYTEIDHSAMTFMFEEGCGFVTRSWLERFANTVLATCTLGDIFVRNDKPTPVPYSMNGGNQIPSLVSPWNSNKSTTGAKNILADYNASALAAYDTHGELAALVEREYKRHSNPASYPGAPSGLLLAAAKREGRV